MASGAPGKVGAFIDEFKPDHIVTLLRDDEKSFQGIKQGCADRKVGWTHLPLSGANAVLKEQRSASDAESLARIPEVAKLLQAGKKVAVHCAAGMHRTGAVCYAACRLAGLGEAEALEAVRATRRLTANEIDMPRKGGPSIIDGVEKLLSEMLPEAQADGETSPLWSGVANEDSALLASGGPGHDEQNEQDAFEGR
uniref:Tyrosine specific protein phosphatases domain-containing protein n=1 Tax=Zooxanthella nutricula TaxID=1333877 RepID=A0A7S2IGB3_9DINO